MAFTPVDEPVFLGRDPDDAFAFVRTMGLFRGLTSGLEDAVRAEIVASVRTMLADHQTPAGVQLGSGAWLITARKEGSP